MRSRRGEAARPRGENGVSIFQPVQPEPPEPKADAGLVWKPHQRYLLEWFRKEAPSLAPAYEAALRLINDVSFPARVHLVCHIVRDIYSKLPEILDADYRRKDGGTVYRDAVEKLVLPWTGIGSDPLVADQAPAEAERSTAVSVPIPAVRAVRELLDLHRDVKSQPKSVLILTHSLYRRFVDTELKPSSRLIDAFEAERKWFTRSAHLVREPAKVPTGDDLLHHFATFESALHSLVAPYFAGKQEIDAILQQANQ